MVDLALTHFVTILVLCVPNVDRLDTSQSQMQLVNANHTPPITRVLGIA